MNRVIVILLLIFTILLEGVSIAFIAIPDVNTCLTERTEANEQVNEQSPRLEHITPTFRKQRQIILLPSFKDFRIPFESKFSASRFLNSLELPRLYILYRSILI